MFKGEALSLQKIQNEKIIKKFHSKNKVSFKNVKIECSLNPVKFGGVGKYFLGCTCVLRRYGDVIDAEDLSGWIRHYLRHKVEVYYRALARI